MKYEIYIAMLTKKIYIYYIKIINYNFFPCVMNIIILKDKKLKLKDER